jgi:hypothetical protein
MLVADKTDCPIGIGAEKGAGRTARRIAEADNAVISSGGFQANEIVIGYAFYVEIGLRGRSTYADVAGIENGEPYREGCLREGRSVRSPTKGLYEKVPRSPISVPDLPSSRIGRPRIRLYVIRSVIIQVGSDVAASTRTVSGINVRTEAGIAVYVE